MVRYVETTVDFDPFAPENESYVAQTGTAGKEDRATSWKQTPVDFDPFADDAQRPTSFVGEVGNAVARGWNRLEQGANVIGAQTGYYSPDEAASQIAANERDIAKYPMSNAEEAGMKAWQDANGFADSFMALVKNPRVISNVVAESAAMSAPSVVGGAIGGLAGSAAGPIGAATGAAAGVGTGSGLVEYTSSVLDYMKDAGVDTGNEAQLKAALSNPDVMAGARSYAAKRGVAVGVFDALTAGLSGGMAGHTIGRTLARGAIEAGGGAAGEASAQLASTGKIKSGKDIALEAIGELPGIVTDVGPVAAGRVLSGRRKVISDPGGADNGSTVTVSENQDGVPQGMKRVDLSGGRSKIIGEKLLDPVVEPTARRDPNAIDPSGPPLTADDIASPLPNGDIQRGKAIMDAITKGAPLPGQAPQASPTSASSAAAATPAAPQPPAGDWEPLSDEQDHQIGWIQRRTGRIQRIEEGAPNVQPSTGQMEPAADQAAAPSPQVGQAPPSSASAAPSNPSPVLDQPVASSETAAGEVPVATFRTAKGSTYDVHPDGTTSRNKAYRPEHGPDEQGPQPRSQRTFYVTPEDAEKLGEFQAKGGGRRTIQVRGNEAAMRYEDGENAGKYEARTRVKVSTEPSAGLLPVETWNDGSRVHFGNVITEVSTGSRQSAIEAIDTAANEAATSPKNDIPEPTQAQKEAGNYKVGRVRIGGMDISIENPKGSERKGVDADGEPWSVTMPAHYGYVRRTEGADGDHVDVYIGDNPESDKVFVVDQVDAKTGKFDEHKAILGANSLEDATRLYDAGFSDGKGPQRRGAVTEMSVRDFRDWAENGDTKRPLADLKAAGTDNIGPIGDIGAKPSSDTTPSPQKSGENEPPTQQVSTTPYTKKGQALIAAKRAQREQGGTWEPVPIDGGWGVKKVSEVTPGPAKPEELDATVQASTSEPAPQTALKAKIEAKREAKRRVGQPPEPQAKRQPAKARRDDYETYQDRLENYFRPGRVVPSYWGADRVVSFKRGTKGGGLWSVKVTAINDTGSPLIDTRVREHETAPTEKALAAWERENPVGSYRRDVPDDKPQRSETPKHTWGSPRPFVIGDDINVSARDHVLAAGKETGVEHVLMVSQERGVLSNGSGTASGSGWNSDVNTPLNAKEQQFDAHHNHPKNSPLSAGDINMLAKMPGLRWVWAHGHAGRISGATLTEQFVALRRSPTPSGWDPVYAFINVVRDALTDMTTAINIAKEVKADLRTATDEEADHALSLSRNIVLYRAGLIDYQDSDVTNPFLPHISREIEDAAKRISRRFRNHARAWNDRLTDPIQQPGRLAGVPEGSRKGSADAGGRKPEKRSRADDRGQEAVTKPGIASRDTGIQDTAITSSGRSIPVRYAVVEAADLIASQDDAGRVNPDYPADLQPRDRSRGVSGQQISDIAKSLNPRLLDRSAKASDGAPIISADGVVESGNGRTLAIRRAYTTGAKGAAEYRQYLADQGYPVDGMRRPVLVRVRDGKMTPDERRAFTREANERDTLAMSATEQAMADAAAIADSTLDLYRGGDVDAAANRPFVRAFMQSAVGSNEQAAMVAADGSMSQQAIRRVEAALLGKAYGDADLVAALVESADTNIKAIGGALLDVSPAWAKMRAAVRSGEIAASMDQTLRLLDAVRLVQRARREGRPVGEYVGQKDIFSGTAVDPITEAFLRLMFRNDQTWTRPAGRDRMSDDLRFYVEEAQKTRDGTDLLGQSAPQPVELVNLAKERKSEQANGEQVGIDFNAPADGGAGKRIRSPGGLGEEPAREDGEPAGVGSAQATGQYSAKGLASATDVSAPAGREQLRRAGHEDSPSDLFTESSKRRRAEIRRIVKDAYRSVAGDDAEVKAPMQLLIDTDDMRTSATRSGNSQATEAYGLYNPVADVAFIASQPFNRDIPIREMTETAYHEAFHRLQLRFFTKKELTTLNGATEEISAFLRRATGLDLDITPFETQAYAFQVYAGWKAGDRKIRGMVNPRDTRLSVKVRMLWDRLSRFISSVRSAFQGRGWNTWQDLFDKAISGEIGRRQQDARSAKEFLIASGISSNPDEDYGFANPRDYVDLAMQSGFRSETMAQSVGLTEDERQEATGKLFSADFGAPRRRVAEMLFDRNKSLIQRLKGAVSADAVAESVDNWRFWFQDLVIDLKKVQGEISQATGIPIPEMADAYTAHELVESKTGPRMEKLHEEMVEPLLRDLHSSGIAMEDLERYLYARHAPERNARIAEINPKLPTGGSGMTDEEASRIMTGFDRQGKTEALEALAERVDAILKFAVDTRVEAGLLSEEQAETWRSLYQNYVPLRGYAELDPELADERPNVGGSGVTVRGAESRRALGRKSEAADILPHAIAQAQEAIIRAERNCVGQALYNLATSFPNKRFWETDKVEMKAVWNSKTEQVEYRPVRMLSSIDERHTVSLKIDGKEHRVTFNVKNPRARRLAEGLRRLKGQEFGAVVRWLGSFNRWLSAVNTGFNPEFVITNAFRDIQSATVNLSKYDIPKIVSGTLKDYRKAMVGSMKGAFGKESGEWGHWYREFTDAGGRTYWNQVDSIKALRERLEAQVADMSASSTNPMVAMRRVLRTIGGTIEALNMGVENSIRLSAYKNARERGMTPQQAASLAKNLTVNFNRRGAVGPLTNAFYLFYNASVQGSQVLISSLKSRRVQKIAGGIIGFSASLTLYNLMASDDDDDGEKVYNKISDFEKQRNLIIMLPNTGGRYIKIPLPYGYNVFSTIGRTITEAAFGRPPLDAVSDVAITALDAFNPIGGSDNILKMISPTITDPIVELYSNRDFTGKPIVPENPQYGPAEPAAQRYWSNVPVWAKSVTDALTSLTGGDNVRPGAIDISPEVLDYALGVVAGAAGSFYGRASDMALKLLDPTSELTSNDIPFYRRVVGEKPSWYNKAVFYERANQIAQQEAYIKRYQEDGSPQGARDVMRENKALLSLSPMAKATRKKLSEIRKDRDATQKLKARGSISSDAYTRRMNSLRDKERDALTIFNRAYIKRMSQQ